MISWQFFDDQLAILDPQDPGVILSSKLDHTEMRKPLLRCLYALFIHADFCIYSYAKHGRSFLLKHTFSLSHTLLLPSDINSPTSSAGWWATAEIQQV